jgi:hypothetical protein
VKCPLVYQINIILSHSPHMHLICFGTQYILVLSRLIDTCNFLKFSLVFKPQVELDPSLVEAADGEDTLGKYIEY